MTRSEWQKNVGGNRSRQIGILTQRAELTTDPAQSGQVDQALEWLTHLLRSGGDVRADEVTATVTALSEPARPEWTMGRVAVLLNPYFDKATPHGIRVAEAEDWADELAEFPEWAIDRAVKWWKSAENKDRRKRPLEGDIAARCKVEMMAVRAAKIKANAKQ